MLQISKLTDYSIVIMAYLARNPAGLHTARDMALHTKISLPTVTKILKMLTRGGLLVSQRGTSGGYSMAKSPQEIAITTIIEAIEGDLGLTECSHGTSQCSYESCCATRNNWRLINQVIYNTLSNISLAQMALPLDPKVVSIPLHQIITTKYSNTIAG